MNPVKRKLILTKKQQIILLLILPFAAAGFLLLAKNLYVRFVVPWMPPCILRTATGWKCPSCGMTHAVYALCRLDFAEALRQNALLVFGLLMLILRYLEEWFTVLGKPKKLVPRRAVFWIIAGSAGAAYSVLRNIIGI